MPKPPQERYPTHLFPEIDADDEYQFAATAGQQAGRPYWMINLNVQGIRRLFADFLDRAEHDPRSLTQRSLNPSRARKLKRYILDETLPGNGFYILPPLVVSVDAEEYAFDEVADGMGHLTLPSDAQFWLGDGQHRAAGLLMAYLEAPALLQQETVGVMLLPDGGNQIRNRIFLDINANPSKPSKSLAVLFNDRDPMAAVTRTLIATGWIERFTNLERTTLPKQSPDLFTLNGWRDANYALLVNCPEAEWGDVAGRFWAAIAQAIPQWKQVARAGDKPINTQRLRQETICFHSITLAALGLLGQRLMSDQRSLTTLKGLKGVDWRRNNPDWEGLFLIEGRIVKNRQTTERLADYLYSKFVSG